MPDMAGLSRRHFLVALGAGGLAASTRPLGRDPLGLAGESGSPAAAPTPVPAGRVAAAARAGLQRLGGRVPRPDVVAVADFSRPSSQPRLHLADMAGGGVMSFLVAHGRGSDPARTGWLRRFSNVPGSDCTSEGAFLTGDFYVGEHGRSLRVAGLDPTNSNAEARAIVIHPAWYASPAMVRADGMLGRSEGCFAVSQADAPQVLERLGPGRLLVAARLA